MIKNISEKMADFKINLGNILINHMIKERLSNKVVINEEVWREVAVHYKRGSESWSLMVRWIESQVTINISQPIQYR